MGEKGEGEEEQVDQLQGGGSRANLSLPKAEVSPANWQLVSWCQSCLSSFRKASIFYRFIDSQIQ